MKYASPIATVAMAVCMALGCRTEGGAGEPLTPGVQRGTPERPPPVPPQEWRGPGPVERPGHVGEDTTARREWRGVDDRMRPAAVAQRDRIEARRVLAIAQPQTEARQQLEVRSEAFAHSRSIPQMYSDYGEGISPDLSWSTPPEATESMVILMEDPDMVEPRPFVHWIVYNLPGDKTSIGRAIPPAAKPEQLDGALQGKNSRGSIGYFGPRPPQTDPPHHYHFQIFALNRKLNLPPGATREDLLRAMRGHMLAKGELIGTFQRR